MYYFILLIVFIEIRFIMAITVESLVPLYENLEKEIKVDFEEIVMLEIR